jgi:hypothetical protein
MIRISQQLTFPLGSKIMKHFLLPLIFIFLFSFAAFGQTPNCTYSTRITDGEDVYNIGTSFGFTVPSFGQGLRIYLVSSGQGCVGNDYGLRGRSNAAWLFVGGTYNASGIRYESVFATDNATGQGRSGYVEYTIPTTSFNQSGGRTLNISQEANTCVVSLSDKAPVIPTFASMNLINLSADSNCDWSATSNADWIKVNTATGTGINSISYSVEGNPSVARRGVIRVNGQKIVINQPSGCTFTPSATSAEHPATAGSGTFVISAYPGCVWYPVSQADWITQTSGASWSGSGALGYTFTANPLTTPRTGTITAGGNTFTITQAASVKSRKRVRFF